MKNNITRQVVILNNFTSPYITEAILVLRDHPAEAEEKILLEAERVVNEYLKHKNGITVKKGQSCRKKASPLKYVMTTIGVCMILAYLIYNFSSSI